MMHKEAVRVSIGGKSYTLVSDETYAHVYEAAALIDKTLNEIYKAGIKDEQKAMVLVGMQLASLLLKEQSMARDQQKLYDNLIKWLESQNSDLAHFVGV